MKISTFAQAKLLASTINYDAAGILLKLIKAGCNGYEYQIELAPLPLTDGYSSFNFDDLRIYVSATDKPILENVEIDIETTPMSWSYTYFNPLEKAKCGCGKSALF